LSLPAFGERDCFARLVGLRAQSLADRITGESTEGPATGRVLELEGAHAIEWRGHRSVANLGPAALARLDVLLDWFADGPVPSFETACDAQLGLVAAPLVRLGYQPVHAHAFYLAGIDALAHEAARESLELVAGPHAFAQVGAALWHEHDASWAARLADQHRSAHWHCLAARVEGELVAATSLFLVGELAYHANALTLPRARGRGLHVALLRAHVEHARALGSTYFVADTHVGSTSARNFERVGMRCVASSLTWHAP
jgi:GNAT superfamily N-acetyltransferase